jgi:hypothetical protein
MMASAAKVTIAEVEHLVDVGELDPDMIHTPSIFVQRIFQGSLYEKRIEKRTVRKTATTTSKSTLIFDCASIARNSAPRKGQTD